MVGSRCSTSRVRQFKNGIKLYGAKSEVWTTSRESLMLCLSFKRWAKKHGSIIALSIRCVLGPNISLTIMIRRLESALMLWLERCRRRRGTELANTHGAFIRTIKKTIKVDALIDLRWTIEVDVCPCSCHESHQNEMYEKGKSLHHPLTYGGGLHNPLNHETFYITPWTF